MPTKLIHSASLEEVHELEDFTNPDKAGWGEPTQKFNFPASPQDSDSFEESDWKESTSSNSRHPQTLKLATAAYNVSSVFNNFVSDCPYLTSLKHK